MVEIQIQRKKELRQFVNVVVVIIVVVVVVVVT